MISRRVRLASIVTRTRGEGPETHRDGVGHRDLLHCSHAMLPDAALVYPAFCNVLSPTINRWVKLTAVDIAGLRRVRGYEGQSSWPSPLEDSLMTKINCLSIKD